MPARHGPTPGLGPDAAGVRWGAMSATVSTPVIDPTLADTDEGEHDRFSHYVRKSDIMRANIEGVPAVALCGKKWIPNRDPDKYPVCPTCKELYEALKAAGR